jgi:hypothetical protein
MPKLLICSIVAVFNHFHLIAFLLERSFGTALIAGYDIGPPPSLADAAKEASITPYLIGLAGLGGIFLAGFILRAFITYIVVKE